MANRGVYDLETRAISWFDATSLQEGWWDYGMPFEHDLIGDEPTPPTGTWPGWVISSSSGWF